MGIFLLSLSLIQTRSDELSCRLHRISAEGPVNRPFPFSHGVMPDGVITEKSFVEICTVNIGGLASFCLTTGSTAFSSTQDVVLDMRV